MIQYVPPPPNVADSAQQSQGLTPGDIASGTMKAIPSPTSVATGGVLSNVGNSVNTAAANAFPGLFSSPGSTVAGNGFGATNLMGDGPAATATGALGGAAGGFGGGALVSGIIGGDTMVGGGAGGALGTAAALAGFGPMGIAAGAVLGGIAGKVFQKPRAHPASTFGATVKSDGTFDKDLNFQSKHGDASYGQGVSNQVQTTLKAFSDNGVKFAGKSIHGGIDDGRGFVSIGSGINDNPEKVFQFDPNNPSAQSKAIIDATSYLAQSSGVSQDQINSIIDKIGGPGSAVKIASPKLPGRMITDTQSFSNFVDSYRKKING